MTLEQSAYIAEIIGAVLIIASLVYVAKQLRQNTDAMRVGNQNNLVAVNMGLCVPVINDRSLAGLWIQVGTEFNELDATDRQRLLLQEWQAI